jgi:hypothetical protein
VPGSLAGGAIVNVSGSDVKVRALPDPAGLLAPPDHHLTISDNSPLSKFLSKVNHDLVRKLVFALWPMRLRRYFIPKPKGGRRSALQFCLQPAQRFEQHVEQLFAAFD